jgi:hypothetical protein
MLLIHHNSVRAICKSCFVKQFQLLKLLREGEVSTMRLPAAASPPDVRKGFAFPMAGSKRKGYA